MIVKITLLNKKVWLINYPKNVHINLYEYDLKDKIDEDKNGIPCKLTHHYYLNEKIKHNVEIYVKKGKITHSKFDGEVKWE